MADQEAEQDYYATMLATAKTADSKTFCENFEFADGTRGKTKVTLCNNDLTFAGPVSFLKSRYRNKQDYG